MERYQHGFTNWDAICTEKHWKDVFSTKTKDSEDDPEKSSLSEKIIYLSGDSPDMVSDCEAIQASNDGVFIIGGLIDHNRHKGLALGRAQAAGVAHGQLPIGEHIRLTQRKILAIPHVFEIMLLAANGTMGGNWADIFQKVIPSRKVAGSSDGGDDKEEEAEDDEEMDKVEEAV